MSEIKKISGTPERIKILQGNKLKNKKMKIYDKAAWQIDKGLDKKVVIKHFKFIFIWLKSRKMLSDEGIEVYKSGIDEEISLHENLLTEEGNKFIDKYYDMLITASEYDVEKEKKIINEFRVEFCKKKI